jgi:hypothetical protein
MSGILPNDRSKISTSSDFTTLQKLQEIKKHVSSLEHLPKDLITNISNKANKSLPNVNVEVEEISRNVNPISLGQGNQKVRTAEQIIAAYIRNFNKSQVDINKLEKHRNRVQETYLHAIQNFDKPVAENLIAVDQGKIIDISSLSDEMVQKHAKLVFHAGQYAVITASTQEEADEFMRQNPGFVAFVPSQDAQQVINQIHQEMVEKYIAYRLSLIKPETKEKEPAKNAHLAKPSEPILTPAKDEDLAHKAKEEKLLNFDPKLLLQNIVTVTFIIEARKEQERAEAAKHKKEQIEEQELKREIRREEIKKDEIQKVEGKQGELKSEVNTKEKRKSAP